jgi:hypothetical protein
MPNDSMTRNQDILSEKLFESIANHLGFFGYTVTSGTTHLIASHPTKTNFWVLPVNTGALFRALFRTGNGAKNDRNGFLAFLNDANSLCVVSRYSVNDDIMSVQSWFPDCYDQKTFGIFFDQFLADIYTPYVRYQDSALPFFSD